ncbi:MAG: 2-C-methyl-D-erythritol 2,4-cyclodiphosphate synthase [Firmicutes bacterium]|nr:2-C-methyl-D-erythritol 2,4-cyclodiphosphate synthase [Bacillota bacterium]
MDYSGKDVIMVMAAGAGRRLNLGYNKLFYQVCGKTILEYTLDKFTAYPVVVVCAEADRGTVDGIAARYPNVSVAEGGGARYDSVENGLNFIGSCAYVAIHDGARPNVAQKVIEAAFRSAKEYGSGIVYVQCADSLRDMRKKTVNRDDIVMIQTPQVFEYGRIKVAYAESDTEFTDDSQVYEHYGFSAAFVPGDPDNYKITSPPDLERFERSKRAEGNMRIGTGYDVHKLAQNRKLVLGGVEIPHFVGLDGWSDADVLTHAVMDALLSAAGEPDIGVLFPDADPQYKNAASVELLKQVCARITDKGFKIAGVSAVVHAERPRIADHIAKIRESLAAAMGIDIGMVNVSATTWEGLSFVGRKEGIAAGASCIIF